MPLQYGRATIAPINDEQVEYFASDIEVELIAAAQQSAADFGPLYERYVDQVYRFAYRRIGNRADAEDVTAQTFQQALAALPAYEWRGRPFGAWLYRIASNIIARRGRTSAREITMDDVSTFDRAENQLAGDPADFVGRSTDADELLGAIRKLPCDQQRALVLKFAHGLKNREIGEKLGR